MNLLLINIPCQPPCFLPRKLVQRISYQLDLCVQGRFNNKRKLNTRGILPNDKCELLIKSEYSSQIENILSQMINMDDSNNF